MARPRVAITQNYFRLLPLVSAFVLLAGLGVPSHAYAQNVQDQLHFNDHQDEMDAERQKVIDDQNTEKAINDAESENSLRAHQNELDQHLQDEQNQIQQDAAAKEAQDRANYLKSLDTDRAAAIAKEGHEAAKKTDMVKKAANTIPEPTPTPTPTTPKQDLSPDSIIGAPSMAGTNPAPVVPPAAKTQSAADALIASPATAAATPPAPVVPTTKTSEEKAVDDAVAAAIAQAKTDAAKELPLSKAADIKPIPETAKAETPPPAMAPAPVADKTPPPPLETPKLSKKSEAINDALADYEDVMQDILIAGMPSHSIADISALTKLQDKGEPKLSLNSIVMFALDDNPDVAMAKARKEQAEHNVGRARAALYPHLDMSLEKNEEYNDPAAGKTPAGPYFNPSDRVALTLNQMIFDGGITDNTIKQREQAVTGANFDIDSNTKDVLTNTVQQYLNVLKFQSTLKDNQEFIARLQNIEGVINTTYQMGGSAKNDVEYAESRMASAESGLENVKSSLNDAVSNLQSLTGPLPDFIASPPDELDPERVKLDEYVKLAQQNNNDVLANENDLQQMKYKLKTDKGAFMPRVNVVMNGERTYDDGGPTGRDLNGKATLQMSYSIFDGNERKENVKRTQAMISEIVIKRRKIMDDLRKQLRLSYNQMTSLQTNISKTKAEISSSQSLQDLNRENFENGTVSLIELIEGEERLNNARAKLHQQESDLYLSAYKLLLQVGIMKKNFFCNNC